MPFQTAPEMPVVGQRKAEWKADPPFSWDHELADCGSEGAEVEAAGSVCPTLPITVEDAPAKFLSESEARELREVTLKKSKVLLTREPNPTAIPEPFSPNLIMYTKLRRIDFLLRIFARRRHPIAR